MESSERKVSDGHAGRQEVPEVRRALDPLQQQLEWAHRRTRQLMDESLHYQNDSRALREELVAASRDRQRLERLLKRADRLVQSMGSGIKRLRGSVSLQAGYLVTQSTRSIGDMLLLPFRLLRLLRQVRRSASGTSQQVVDVPLPHEWFPIELGRELATFDSCVSDEYEADQSTIPAGRHKSLRFATLPERLSDIRMAAVMDEFSFSAYRSCCAVTQLTPDGWRGELEEIKPHLLFIESAWDGKDSTWQRKVSGSANELRELAAYCRHAGIPVVFWSKEDPVHFKTFLSTARLADVVFTTDIDCIRHYKIELGHERVFLLPFATQPLSHNPIERFERKPGFCFAGSYYVRYPVRQRDFATLLRAVSELAPVEIYDRNFGNDHPNYVFPEEYKPYIIGNLAFDQIDLAYKGYEFGININTVKNSQSMFARRVFDLLASNTTTVSNYSRGLRLMFGDLVVSSDDRTQVSNRLRELLKDETSRRKHRLLGLRKVMREHTYQHRLSYLLRKIFGDAPRAHQPMVTVLSQAGSWAEIHRILAAFQRQTWPHKRLVLNFRDGFQPECSPASRDIQVLSTAQAALRRVADLAGDGYVAGLHPDDYYGPNYLTDLALAAGYCPATAVGKAAYYVRESGSVLLLGDGAQYHTGGVVAHRRGMALAEQLGDVTIANWLESISEGKFDSYSFSIDEFNYCANSPGLTSCAEVDDLEGVNEGAPIEDLLSAAERIHGRGGAESGQRDESAGMPGLEAAELFERMAASDNKYLTMAMSDGKLRIRSTLPAGRHAYAYLIGDFSPQQLHFADIARMQLVSEGGGDELGLVLVYRDRDGEKISHSLLRSAANVTASVPQGTHSVQLGLRIGQAGDYSIRRLVFDHVPLAVDTMVTRSRVLLLAKNYPSYGDLYKHAFVHRRVVEYRKRGVEVDVFRIGGNGLSFYEFEGVDVAYGQAEHLRTMLHSGSYDAVLVHVLDERMWEVLGEFVDSTRVYVWAHGAEIQSASRRECDHAEKAARTRAIALGERRMQFWRRIFEEKHPNLKMVFVSDWAARDVMEDVGIRLPTSSYRVIHNFIDTDLFRYEQKSADQRKRILSIRPFASRVYANDLSVRAILELSRRPFFEELEFRIVGDGPLFEETTAQLRGLSNVTIERRFLTQREIANLHREYGVFLVPSRMDSQGVSRDEAMASGLVPVTSRVAAIPEFVDENCGLLTEPEDAVGLADAIERIYRDPALFQSLSVSASSRVRRQSGYEATIAREIALFDAQAIGL